MIVRAAIIGGMLLCGSGVQRQFVEFDGASVVGGTHVECRAIVPFENRPLSLYGENNTGFAPLSRKAIMCRNGKVHHNTLAAAILFDSGLNISLREHACGTVHGPGFSWEDSISDAFLDSGPFEFAFGLIEEGPIESIGTHFVLGNVQGIHVANLTGDSGTGGLKFKGRHKRNVRSDRQPYIFHVDSDRQERLIWAQDKIPVYPNFQAEPGTIGGYSGVGSLLCDGQGLLHFSGLPLRVFSRMAQRVVGYRPQADSGPRQNYRESGDEGVRIGVNKRTGANDGPTEQQKEAGRTVWMLLGSGILAWLAYALLKRWGEGESGNNEDEDDYGCG